MTWVPQLPQGDPWAYWLLRDGVWDDVGQWSDVDYWNDNSSPARPTWSVQVAQSEVWTDVGSV